MSNEIEFPSKKRFPWMCFDDWIHFYNLVVNVCSAKITSVFLWLIRFQNILLAVNLTGGEFLLVLMMMIFCCCCCFWWLADQIQQRSFSDEWFKLTNVVKVLTNLTSRKTWMRWLYNVAYGWLLSQWIRQVNTSVIKKMLKTNNFK